MDASDARRSLSEVRQWPVGDAAQLPSSDDLLAPRSVWQRGAGLTLTPAFGVAAAAYVVCVWIVIGSAASPVPVDQLPTARDVDSGQWDAPPAAEVDGVTPYRPPVEVAGRNSPPVEQVDQGFFTGLQNVLNGIESQPGQPRPYQPDVPGILPATEPVLDPLAPVPSDPLAPPVVGPDGQLAEAPPVTPPVVGPDGQLAVAPPLATPVPQAPVDAPQTPVVVPEVPAVAPQTPVVSPEPPVVTPEPPVVTPTAVAPSAPPPGAGQPPLGPPPGPAG